jgi:hypothetical protein
VELLATTGHLDGTVTSSRLATPCRPVRTARDLIYVNGVINSADKSPDLEWICESRSSPVSGVGHNLAFGLILAYNAAFGKGKRFTCKLRTPDGWVRWGADAQ